MGKLNSMEDFQRNIGYLIKAQEDGSICLTGTLRDRFHDIEAVIVVEPQALQITESRVEFRKAPSCYCERAEERMKLLIGVNIGKGLTRCLNEVFGGEQGCGNLRTMLAGLLPLAINVKAATGFADEQKLLASIAEKLSGTCIGYPKDETKA
jgi:hypothetical protein